MSNIYDDVALLQEQVVALQNADGNIRITTHSTGTCNANYYLRLSTSFSIG